MEDKILNKIIVALKDNEKDKKRAFKEDDFEEEAFCRGYENALCFVLSLYDISYDKAMAIKTKKKK